MLEVEVKYRVTDLAALEREFTANHGRFLESRSEEDNYFNAPDRDFAKTDEALRVRSIGDKNFITYKGPKFDAQTKTRKEIEIPLPDGRNTAADFQNLLTHLGYRLSGTVRKARRVYEIDRDGFRIHASLDEVTNLGSFAELEIMADESVLAKAKSVVLQLAASLGLSEIERRSYLELLLSGPSR